jgi:hypothetical protein
MLKQRRSPESGQALISATEIACWAYCPEQWRLEHGLGLTPSNRATTYAGTRHHERKAVAERVAGGSIALGRLLVIVALVLLLFSLVWR